MSFRLAILYITLFTFLVGANTSCISSKSGVKKTQKSAAKRYGYKKKDCGC